MKSIRVAAVLCTLLFATLHAALPQDTDEAALEFATRDLCHRQVVMLGESATHGDGHAVSFKVALIKRLVTQCGFDAVYFEASHYEFLHISQQLHASQVVYGSELLDAVGGLWKYDREFQPIVPFLLTKAQSGQVMLGGLDDQLGQMGQDYANAQMILELTARLPEPQRQTCALALHRRIFSDYPAAAPYSEADHARIATCLAGMRQAIAADTTTERTSKEEQLERIAAIQRWIGRDFLPDGQWVAERDRSMFQNFAWLQRQKPERHKVIVWAATVHIAKQADPTWGDRSGINFGSFVHRRYGSRAFSLGFSATEGCYQQGGQHGAAHPIPTPPSGSIEALASRSNTSNALYIGGAQLRATGTSPGEVFYHPYQALPWASFLDGIVIFRKEWPPKSIH